MLNNSFISVHNCLMFDICCLECLRIMQFSIFLKLFMFFSLICCCKVMSYILVCCLYYNLPSRWKWWFGLILHINITLIIKMCIHDSHLVKQTKLDFFCCKYAGGVVVEYVLYVLCAVQVQLVCSLTCWSWWARWWPQQAPPGPSGWCSLWRVWSLAGTAGSASSSPERPLVSGADPDTHPSLCTCSGWQGYVSGHRSGENKATELEAWL